MKVTQRFAALKYRLTGWFQHATNPVSTTLHKISSSQVMRKTGWFITTKWFVRIYPLFGLVVLLISTIFWAILGARLNLQNSDQLVNAYLFEKPETFKEALLPGSHSFLLKWPLFWLIKTLHYTNDAYIGVTVGVVLVTVAAFAFILYRIERRPLVFGTILLALTSVLMLIPTIAYAGALLPVNMAMLASRNIEYVIYIAGLTLLTRSRRVRSVQFWLGAVVLVVLIASDKLFLYLTAGGAILAVTAYGLSAGWNLVSTSARWVVAAILAGIGATGILWLVNFADLTHIVNQSGIGPYGLVTNVHDLSLGVAYGILHVLTNFGANPAATTMLLRSVPHDAWANFLTLSGPAYLLNLIVFATVLIAAYEIIRHSLAHNKDKNIWLDNSSKLSIAMVWTSAAAVVLFVVSKHYYAADARYLGIVLFGLFITGATYLGRRQISSGLLVSAGTLFTVGTLLTISGVIHAYQQDQTALAPTNQRNIRIAAALKQHSVHVLVGDYWRVLPIHSLSSGKQNVMPLQSCTTPRDTLTSRVWQPDLNKTSFAYILTLDGSLTDYPQCTLRGVIDAYGRPNGSIVIAGTIAHPKELVLFYDRGAHKSAPIATLRTPSTVLPIELEDLPYTSCKQPTTMNFVAHEDDDLLFMNPDLLADIKAGNCVRTVYVTAGDAGMGSFYWLGREQGSQAAYASMLGFKDIWVQRVVHLDGDQYATIANPRGNQKISLVYLHLPDGNMHGQGFTTHNDETLADLDAGKISLIHDVYDGAAYTKSQLVGALTSLMQTFQPTEINTQSNIAMGTTNDHSDHMAVGRLTKDAYQNYESQHFADKVIIPIKYYIGYPIRTRPVNVFGTQLQEKQNAFAAYIQYDGATCRTIPQCMHDPAYGMYLPREYQNSY